MKIYFAAGKSGLNRINIATAFIWSALKIIFGGNVIMSVSKTNEEDVVYFRNGALACTLRLTKKTNW
ncbi:hypothetical protein D7N80_14960 [Salmonella enterica subsp. enterica]|uniref:Uncharacterized protein n=1 Tax=Salmonella enterica I TaxID=59201 RepID=A0A403QIX1_SALET|nr:hypothetical protein [Salmonella enterica subsp. enterica serovar Kidderminster]